MIKKITFPLKVEDHGFVLVVGGKLLIALYTQKRSTISMASGLPNNTLSRATHLV